MKLKIQLLFYVLVFLLIGLSGFILFPFAVDLLWSIVIAAATWPLFIRIEKFCRFRRALAVTVMTFIMILVVGTPLLIGLLLLIKNSHTIFLNLRNLFASDSFTTPEWLVNIPLAGEQLGQLWEQSFNGGVPGLLTRFEAFVRNNASDIVQDLERFSSVFGDIVLIIIATSFFYAVGDRLIATVRAVIQKNLGSEASHCFKQVGDAIRSVAFGVVGSAIITALVVAIGLAIAQIPHLFTLAVITFASCVLMIGPLVIMVPVTIWLLFDGAIDWAIFMLVWTVLTIVFDEWFTAALIKGGSQMPAVMIFFGVMGGVLCFGVIGIFLGPVLLEITYSVLYLFIKKNLESETT